MEIVAVIFGMLLGGGGVWLVMRAKIDSGYQRGVADTLAQSKDDTELNAALQQVAVGKEKERQFDELRQEHQALQEECAGLRESKNEGEKEIVQLKISLEDEKKLIEEKLKLMNESRERLNVEFKNLANELLEEKSKKFTESNRVNIEGLLKPLSEKIVDFEKKVNETYEKETKDRVSLRNEIKQLHDLNTMISKDAINLTHALKGESKTQGNWGEVILERVLEESGLTRDREYEIQKSLMGEDGRRFQPDVIIRLPEDKCLVIDSKVSITAYIGYCESEDEDERTRLLKAHIGSIATHIDSLSRKEYQNLYDIKTLDFVLMFIPVEPAFSLAVQKDLNLFQKAFEKNIVIVSPSTLLATLKTIASIWRNEYQNHNAVEIAKRSGDLYDKFVGFVGDLEEIGKRITSAGESYDKAMGKLKEGKGNLIGRAEKIKDLGAKATKSLPKSLLENQDPENAED